MATDNGRSIRRQNNFIKANQQLQGVSASDLESRADSRQELLALKNLKIGQRPKLSGGSPTTLTPRELKSLNKTEQYKAALERAKSSNKRTARPHEGTY